MTTTGEHILPAPLTPPDCNLKDFAFMPLDVARLRDSDMASEQTPEENWAAVLLWAAAWHQVPAGSIPASDNWIAKTAGYLARGRIDPHWEEVRAGAMRGFILCSDGRWYHPVVAEKANESWRAKATHAWSKECDRIRKANKKRESEDKPPLPFPPEPFSDSESVPAEVKEIPPEIPGSKADAAGTAIGNPPEKPLKGQGEGQGELTNPPKPPDGGLGDPKERKAGIALQTFLDECEAKGERPLRDYAPLWEYTKAAGLSQDLVALAWIEFRRRFGHGGTKAARRQKNWRQTFRNYVENNYLKLWYVDGNAQYVLTTQGQQAKKTYESKEAA